MDQTAPATGDTGSTSEGPTVPPEKPAVRERSLWAERGIEDVYFQREAQIGWWSILGGIAAGALLTQLGPLVDEIQAGNGYLILYYAASALAIVVSWVMTVWGSLILWLPIVPLHVLIVFLNGFATSVLCLFPTSPARWYTAATAFMFAGLLLEFYDLKANTWRAFPAEAASRSRATMVVHAVFLVIAACGAITLHQSPSRGAEVVGGIAAVLVGVVALVLEQSNMRRERQLAGIP